VNLGELFKTDGSQNSALPRELSTTEASTLVFDTRGLKPGAVFVAIRGSRTDGHAFLKDAVASGAVALVVEDPASVPTAFKGYVRHVTSTRHELARLASIWSGEPSKNLFTVGVTGTNGKTTTTHMIESLLNSGGIPTGVIGTIDHHLGSKIWPTEMTTPDPIAFQSRLKEFVKLGAKAVALEASSHSLDKRRVEFVDFEAAVFKILTIYQI
jgi:UDP-N-acetylmuramoyl-L-alanyl-D-glutamate--2,6-diaminopimelate ligase